MQQNKARRNRQFQFIDTPSELGIVAEKLATEERIAADVEADSMFNFKEKVCLVQIASRRYNVIIDTVKIRNMSLLKPVFLNRNIQKVFHGADFDIRSLYRDFGIRIENLFDTELASRFLGIRETGLESVLKDRFGVKMDKRFQKKDWSQRPLPREMIEYAANDVTHLLPLTDILTDDLKRKGRLSWVQEECDVLSKVRPVSVSDEDPLFIKVKGAGRLAPLELAVLEALLKYRLKIAEKKDVPPFKVMANGVLVKLAKLRPKNAAVLKDSGILSNKQIDMYGGDVVNIIRRARNLPATKLPRYPRRRSPVLTSRVHERIKALKVWRNTVADGLAMDPGLILNKTLLTALAVQKPTSLSGLKKIDGLRRWQKRQYGAEMIRIMQNNR